MAKKKVKKKAKGPGGRPEKYRPEYCDMVIEHMEKGFSFESFAGVVDTCVDTLYEWGKRYPEFFEAKKKAFAKCRIFWEAKGVEGLFSETVVDGRISKSKSMNSAIWIFNMKNRFRWTDKVEHSVDPQKNTINLNYNVDDIDS